MVLSMKKTLALALCVSTLAASEVAQTSALRTHPRRALSGIHHVTQYAPKVVKQPTPPTPEEEDDDSSLDSYDSYDVEESGSVDVELQGSEELEIDSSQSLDLDFDGSGDLDVDLGDGEDLDYSGEGDQSFDLSSSGDLDFSASASLDASGQLDTDVEFTDGSVDVELDDDEDYTQDLDFESNEVVDEIIDVPEGAKSIHLRVHNGNVDLDIIKGAKKHAKKETQPEQKKEEVAAAQPEQKKEETADVATESKEETVSFAAEAKEWVSENSSKPAFLGGLIGAAVGLVGVAGVAIAKTRKRTSEKSVLAEDVAADAEADAEVDEDAESESDSDSDSDEDVEAGVTALTEEDAAEEKKSSVVEGSV
ncbi:hypothetical protein KRP22_000294 [Phytophthora ramorum]|nr:hypothetical protein KRP23_7138 [Phytophthora ramorum]KAH7498123.1 hypothetical protein KRP22_12240 [Phytophthora ramorum]